MCKVLYSKASKCSYPGHFLKMKLNGLGMRLHGLGMRLNGLGMRLHGLGMRLNGLGIYSYIHIYFSP